MNRETKELNTKTNDELCALITRLNSQLLESRFKMAVGEVDKTHVISQIRKTIARCMFILNQRGYDISIGSHGVYTIDKKTNKVQNVTQKVQKILSEPETISKKETKKEEPKTTSKKEEPKKPATANAKKDKPATAKKPAKEAK
ncbi:MAG: 50S ribosomal protein L29 [Mycoplasma sp.]|nr:50S ribosomal protein L29 [Mycoplasma sp.]